MGKSRFVFRNLNPAKRECADDVVRALAYALQEDWAKIYEDLSALGLHLSCMPSDMACYKEYLIRCGYKRVGISNRKGGKRPTVQRFAETHTQGVYLLQAARRLIPLVDGRYYDTLDCGRKCLYAYWLRPSKTP